MDDPREVAAYSEADFTDVNRKLARVAVDFAGLRGRAVDLGTGPASIAIELCDLAPDWEVLAVDAGRRMLAEARRRVKASGLSRNVAFLLADALDVPKPSGSFDLVLSNSLLHHIGDPIGLWREVYRLARAGGSIVVQDLCRPSGEAAARKLVTKHAADASATLRELFHQSLLAAYRPEEVEEQLRLAGVPGLSVRKITDRHLLVVGKKAKKGAPR